MRKLSTALGIAAIVGAAAVSVQSAHAWWGGGPWGGGPGWGNSGWGDDWLGDGWGDFNMSMSGGGHGYGRGYGRNYYGYGPYGWGGPWGYGGYPYGGWGGYPYGGWGGGYPYGVAPVVPAAPAAAESK